MSSTEGVEGTIKSAARLLDITAESFRSALAKVDETRGIVRAAFEASGQEELLSMAGRLDRLHIDTGDGMLECMSVAATLRHVLKDAAKVGSLSIPVCYREIDVGVFLAGKQDRFRIVTWEDKYLITDSRGQWRSGLSGTRPTLLLALQLVATIERMLAIYPRARNLPAYAPIRPRASRKRRLRSEERKSA